MREYLIVRGGVELTVQLSDHDAKRTGAKPVTESRGRKASMKAKPAEANPKTEAKADPKAEVKAETSVPAGEAAKPAEAK